MPRRDSSTGLAVAFLLLALVAMGPAVETASAAESSLQEALAKSQESGMPILVLGTATWCAPCQRLKQQLSTDSSLEPLMEQYVSLTLDIDSPEFAEWSSLHEPKGTMVPMIFIVSAEGKELYTGSGVPRLQELTRVLTMGIEQNGDPKELAQLASSRETAEDSDHGVAAVGAVMTAVVEETPSAEEPAEDLSELPMTIRQRRAESCLRMAQVMAEDRPERSRQYAQQAVELAPESHEAELARKLLSTLPGSE